MVLFPSTYIGLSLLLASTSVDGRCQNRRLTYPTILDLDEIAINDEVFELDLEWMEVDPGFSDDDGDGNDINVEHCESTPFMTRALGGSVPGPTLTVSPGMTIKVKFNNKLTYQPDSFSSRIVVEESGGAEGTLYKTTTKSDLSRLNKFNDPDIANLHFHGLHVSGILPSDDTTLEVLPQESFEYVINIPDDHEPGLHWVHPHHHGSSTLQLVGGAALAMIVKDVEDALDGNFSGNVLPLDVSEAPERIHVFQDWDLFEALQTARHANDLLIKESFEQIKGGESVGQRFVTINGKYQPITEMKAGQWERWRFLYAGWQDLPLEFGINYKEENGADCEFYLLAKDGIYLSDYPRGPMVSTETKPLPIPPGGRADFMVRCNNPGGTTKFESLGRKNVLTVNCVENDETSATISTAAERVADSNPLTPWVYDQATLPDYLQPVRNQTASDGCTCETNFEGYDDTSRVNHQIYRGGNSFMHTSYLGAVVERELKGMHEHSYHQHVYPYQLIDFPNRGDNAVNSYFKVGDWHDTYLDKSQKAGAVTIRYKATDIPGKIMVHCHNTLHADNGMIQKEYVRDAVNVGCACSIFGPIAGLGIVDDIDSAKVIGGIPPPPVKVEIIESSSSSLGFSKLLSILVAAISYVVM